MIHKIINILLIPFKIRYIKQTPFIKNWYLRSYYDVFINVGTLSNPSWYNLGANGVATSFNRIYSSYKLTKMYYKSIKYIPYNKLRNYNTVDLHEQIMKEGK